MCLIDPAFRFLFYPVAVRELCGKKYLIHSRVFWGLRDAEGKVLLVCIGVEFEILVFFFFAVSGGLPVERVGEESG